MWRTVETGGDLSNVYDRKIYCPQPSDLSFTGKVKCVIVLFYLMIIGTMPLSSPISCITCYLLPWHFITLIKIFMYFLEIEEHLKKIALKMPKIVPQLLEISYNKTQFHVKLIF